MDLVRDHWKKEDIPTFLAYLETFSKGKEKGEWEQRIVNTSLPAIAVPSTIVDNFVKQIYHGNYLEFLDLWIWENLSCTLIITKLIGKIKDFNVFKKYALTLSQKADNWATIDSMKYKVTRENSSEFLQFAKDCILSSHTFTRRMGLITLLKLTSSMDCSEEVFNILNSLKDEKEYYVNMAAAWLLAECMTKFRDSTIAFYKNNTTNSFIINKSISKCRDSYRISKEDKDYLLQFKIK